jgi:hypothetical protein
VIAIIRLAARLKKYPTTNPRCNQSDLQISVDRDEPRVPRRSSGTREVASVLSGAIHFARDTRAGCQQTRLNHPVLSTVGNAAAGRGTVKGVLPAHQLCINLWKLWIAIGNCVLLRVARYDAFGAAASWLAGSPGLIWSGDPGVLPVRHSVERPGTAP